MIDNGAIVDNDVVIIQPIRKGIYVIQSSDHHP